MKIEINGYPEFRIPLTLEQLAVIVKCSHTHYDRVCKEASIDNSLETHDYRDRGFLVGWQNSIMMGIDFGTVDDRQVSATWRQIDTCLKIMEMRSHLSSEELMIADHLIYDFRGVLNMARKLIPTWIATYETEINQ